MTKQTSLHRHHALYTIVALPLLAPLLQVCERLPLVSVAAALVGAGGGGGGAARGGKADGALMAEAAADKAHASQQQQQQQQQQEGREGEGGRVLEVRMQRLGRAGGRGGGGGAAAAGGTDGETERGNIAPTRPRVYAPYFPKVSLLERSRSCRAAGPLEPITRAAFGSPPDRGCLCAPFPWRWSQVKEEGWYLLVGCPHTRELLTLRRLSLPAGSGRGGTTVQVPLPARDGAGRPLGAVTVYLMSDSYLGLDQQLEVELLPGGGGSGGAAQHKSPPARGAVPAGAQALKLAPGEVADKYEDEPGCA